MIRSGPVRTLAVAAGVSGYTAVLWTIGAHVRLPDVPLLYLPLVIVATLAGVVPGIVAALASTLAFHIFFTNPEASFRVAALQDVVSIVVYLGTTVVITLQISRARASAAEAAHRADVAATLQTLASSGLALSPADHPDRVAEAIAAALGSQSCTIWMRQDDGLRLWASAGTGHEPPPLPAAAQWAEREAKLVAIAAGGGTALRFAPIRGAGVSGVMAMDITPASRRFLDDAEMLEGLSGLVALFWSRAGTAQRELEAEAAKRSNELKTSLLSMVSHELRSPLTAIKATAGGLLQAAEPGLDREALAAIDSETDRLARLVRNLLDASRIEAGQLRPSTHPVRLRRLVGELAVRSGIGEQRLQLAVPADVLVEADPVLLNQVFQNLIENAERHGASPVRVEADSCDATVRVRVTDRGRGVPADALGQIFDRFVRLERGGIGLGLALCRAIVEAHGGTIGAENAPEGGLAVSFTLPAAREAL